MVGLSFFSGYEIPQARGPVLFDPGATFLTPLGMLKHWLFADQQLISLYFRESVRGGVFTSPALVVFLIVNSLIVWLALRQFRN